MVNSNLIKYLNSKAQWVREETLKIHKIAPETRLASSLSPVEIFTVLYYGKILKFNAKNLTWEKRDRFIVSKGHGAVSLYPILADLGFFSKKKLETVCRAGSYLGAIPDCLVPGFETINGALGHGLGVACGIAIALKRKKINSSVFVLVGDGELYEGAVWEAIMFASHHRLNNLILIIDNNRICMLDYCKNVIDLEPLEKKFQVFNWKTKIVNGHDTNQLYRALRKLKEDRTNYPKVLIAHTKKGKGIPKLEEDPLCHIKSLSKEEVDSIMRSWREA